MRRHQSACAELPPVVILAAGKGTRIDSSRPKPLVPLLGQTLIERILRICATVGVREFAPDAIIVLGPNDLLLHAVC